MKSKLRVFLAGVLSLAMFASGIFAFTSPAAAIDEESEIVRLENADLGGVLIASEGNSPLSLTSGDDSQDIETLWEVIDLGLGTVALKNVGTGRYLKTRTNAVAPRYSVLTSRANAGLHASYQWNLEQIVDTEEWTLKNERANRYLDADLPAEQAPRVDMHAMTVRGTAWEIIDVDVSELAPSYNGPRSFSAPGSEVTIDFSLFFSDPLGEGLTYSIGDPLEAGFNPTAMIDPDTGVFTISLDGFYDMPVFASNDAGEARVYIGGIFEQFVS